MNEFDWQVRGRLIALARRREVSSYKRFFGDAWKNAFFKNTALFDSLERISQYERRFHRPLLSGLIVRQDTGRPGGRFFELGAQITYLEEETLREEKWDVTQITVIHDYWAGGADDFFTAASLDLFGEEAGAAYPAGQLHRGDYIKKAIWPVVDRWAKEVGEQLGWRQLPFGKHWQNSGNFKQYLWTQLVPLNALREDVFFTLDYNGTEEVAKVKLDYYFNREYWTDEQRAQFEPIVDRPATRMTIPKKLLLTEYDFDRLVTETVSYIRRNLGRYGKLLATAQLIAPETKVPLPVSDTELSPETYISPGGRDVDFIARAIRQQQIGDAGEQWVLAYERDRTAGFNLSAAQRDSIKLTATTAPYDLDSYDEDKKPVKIEIKTTTLGLNAPFYMSENEKKFMLQELREGRKYRIYRVYDLDLATKQARITVYDFPGDVLRFDKIVSYRVSPKE